MKKIERTKHIYSKPPFFHKFSFLKRFFVFFPISGSLIEIDKNSYNNLNLKNFPKNKFFLEELKIYKNFNPKFNKPENLKSLCLLVSQTCNMKCDYCFVDEGSYGKENRLMTSKVAKDSIDFLIKNSKNKNIEIDFFGGEPLLNWEVIKETIIYGLNESKKNNKNLRFSLTTNGTLLTDDKINFLNENKISLIISLDGPKEVNDKFRKFKNGNGSFDFIYPKVNNLIKKRDSGYYIRGTFTEETKSIFNSAKYLFENGFQNISLEPVVIEEVNPLKIKKESLKKIKKEYEKLGEYIFNERKKGNNLNFYHFLISLDEGPCLGKMSFGCGAGVEYLAVDSTGDLYPCHFLTEFDEFKMGNIYTGIDENLKKYFMNLNDLSKKPKCSNCWAKYLCGGGCIAHSYLVKGDPNLPPQDFCSLQKKRVEIGLFLNNT